MIFKKLGLNVPKTGTFRRSFSGDRPRQLGYEEHTRIAIDRCCRSCHVHGAGLRAVGCPNRALEQSRRRHGQLRPCLRAAGAVERTAAGRARELGEVGRLPLRCSAGVAYERAARLDRLASQAAWLANLPGLETVARVVLMFLQRGRADHVVNLHGRGLGGPLI